MKIFSRSSTRGGGTLKTVDDHGGGKRRSSKESMSSASNLEVTAIVERVRQSSPLLQEIDHPVTAHFHREEISLGSVLRNGEFSSTYQVSKLPYYAQPERPKIDPSMTVRSSITSKGFSSMSLEEEERRRICCGNPKEYSLKQLNRKLVKQHHKKKQRGGAAARQFDLAAATLVLEAQYLARLDHDNIVALRGIPLGGGEANVHEDFFLLTDRMVETLADRLTYWRGQQEALLKAARGSTRRSSSASTTLKLDVQTPVFLEKLDIARGILDALDYLQSEHNMVVLNLNPESIGFNAAGTVQLFDLGHCREVATWKDQQPTTATNKGSQQQQGEEGQRRRTVADEELSVDDLSVMLGTPAIEEAPSSTTTTTSTPTTAPLAPGEEPLPSSTSQMGSHRKVLMTANTQVPRYLAPELVTRGTYRLQSDSYSFALILFEMLTLSKPFANMKPGQHLIQVCIQGKRPNLTLYKFPTALESLLQKGWKHNYSKRLKIATMKLVMGNMTFRRNSSSSANARSSRRTSGTTTTTTTATHSRSSRDTSSTNTSTTGTGNTGARRSSSSRPSSRRQEEHHRDHHHRSRRSGDEGTADRKQPRRGRRPAPSTRPLPERQPSQSLSPQGGNERKATVPRSSLLRRKSDGNLFSMVSPGARKRTVQMSTGRRN